MYAALTWRTEAGIARRAIAVLRDDYASPFWSPIPYWRRLRRRRTAAPALERALQEAAAARGAGEDPPAADPGTSGAPADEP